jgi:hypothetical protein
MNKSNYAYSIMIRQPDFLTDELFCQTLYIGCYDDEPASFDKMRQY